MSDRQFSLDQLISTAALIGLFKEEYPGDQPHWHWCMNGCCVILHEPHMDEYAYFILTDGSIEKMDKYGNIIQRIDM